MDYLSNFLGARSPLPTRKWGLLTVESAHFSAALDGDLVVEVGAIQPAEELYLRIHSQCLFSETLSSSLCDCAEQFEMAMTALTSRNAGMLIYLRMEGRGVGLAAKTKATALEVAGVDTYNSRLRIGVPPEARDFAPIGRYLVSRGFKRVQLLTNNPHKVRGLQSEGLNVTAQSLLVPNPSEHVKNLYRAKSERFGHEIPESVFSK